MTIGTYDIVGKIGSIVELPSSVTSGDVAIMVENAKLITENMTGQSIDLTDIGSDFQGPLTNLGAAFVLSKETGIGTDFSYRLGNFQVAKGQAQDPGATQIRFHLDMANMQIAILGRPIRFDKTTPSV